MFHFFLKSQKQANLILEVKRVQTEKLNIVYYNIVYDIHKIHKIIEAQNRQKLRTN